MEIRKLFLNGREYGSIALADSFFLRLRGMLGRDFTRFDALLIRPCADIHTMFMKYPIDVLFISKDGQVIKAVSRIRPWTPYVGTMGAKSVIEIPAGRAKAMDVQRGDIVSVQ